jgi:signal transduction histidine kinase
MNRSNDDHLFDVPGETAALMRSIDWGATSLGPVAGWTQALRTTVGLLLRSTFPMLLWWGPEFVQIYNDAYRPVPGAKHPDSFGQPGSECWPEIWHIIGPMAEVPFRGGPATTSDDLALLIRRNGFLEETHFKIAYSPVPDEEVEPNGIGGVLATVAETTERVFAERQLKMLHELGAREAEAKTAEQACAIAAATLEGDAYDVPFALFYLLDSTESHLELAGACGFDGVGPANPPRIELGCRFESAWTLATVLRDRKIEVLGGLREKFTALPMGRWSESTDVAIELPLAAPDQPSPYGVLIVGVSPHRALDDAYRAFFELAAGQVVAAIRNARAHEEERLRAEKLAEIDRAKTTFFSNVSHEFRTPLTLLLGPLEDALATSERCMSGASVELAHRNALRLLRLVNALLDFSRIEAGRVSACFAPTDLSSLTKELASAFRSAIERAGLVFIVRCPPLGEPVFVDRGMWEKVVLNLISNAFKFTFEGEIEVTVSREDRRALLRVRDTGIGVASDELPRLFERFHQVEGARARTHEGSGIGLALVLELVHAHGGEIRAESAYGKGTTFTVMLPFGTAHLPADRISTKRKLASTATAASAFVEEALHWRAPLSDDQTADGEAGGQLSGARILLVDDNADMREYVIHLLHGEGALVHETADGEAALAAVQRRPFDLVLTDVMMPRLDGFGLLHALKADVATRALPVIALSARAGEEARVEGLRAGADDYLVKPFSARELVARVKTHLNLARSRREADEARRAAESANRAKDDFLAMLGHELRNPLAPITTALQLMRLRGPRPREQEILERQVGHLTRLVDDLLDVSRITRGRIELRKQVVEVGDVVARAIEVASPMLEQRRHRLDVSVPQKGLRVDVDPDRFAQIISNLLTNASKYSDPGSRIGVQANHIADRVQITVTDEGVGIASEMLDSVFALFFQQPQTLDRSRGGLGLGLAIVRSLVTMHGGTVSAKSDGAGKGSRFTIEVPAAGLGGVASSEKNRTLPRSSPPGGARRILVVDDNEDTIELLRDALEELGYSVRTANDGPSALRAAETFEPDIALVDIGLPVMDGYELAKHLRRAKGRSRELRLVAVTGYGQYGDKQRAAAAGFDRHLIKPIDLRMVEQVVNELCA